MRAQAGSTPLPAERHTAMSTIYREFLTGIRIGCRIIVPALAMLLALAILR